jgi:acetylornithine/N-succinyldiaminopimelate aminotransferase
MPTYARADVAIDHGEGAYLIDTEGRKYLDFASGIAVTSLGHSHPHLVAALVEQAGKVWHTSNLFRIEGQERLARRLVENSFADTVFFNNSGAEAMECAIKTVRKYQHHNGRPERYRIVTFEGAFHGRTLATIAAGGKQAHLEGFGPPVQGFDQVPRDDLKALRAAVTSETAGILLEPVQGEGGINLVPEATLRAVRELADEHGLLVIYDEVQSGMGRTGKLFAYEHNGVVPDVMALAKGLGGGFPVAACLATEKAAAGMVAGSHGSTFGGNPLAMAVANAVLDVLLEEGFMEHIQDVANHLRQQLAMIVDNHGDVIEEVRGLGLFLGLKCKVPNTDLIAALREKGMLSVGAAENVVRLLPPLIIDESHVSEAIEKIEAACEEISP